MSIITLIGIMGAGKSTIGKQLAKITKRKHIDIDNIIIQETQMSINDIFQEYGEKYFRNLEYETIKNTIYNNNDLILSVGGGAFIQNNSRKLLLEQTITIWLKIPLDVVKNRIKSCINRPLIEELNKHFLKYRNSFYQKAWIHIDCSNLSPDKLSLIIAHKLKLI